MTPKYTTSEHGKGLWCAIEMLKFWEGQIIEEMNFAWQTQAGKKRCKGELDVLRKARGLMTYFTYRMRP